MKYLVDVQSCSGFAQFICQPESGDTWAYPSIAQVRMSFSSLLSLQAAVGEAVTRAQQVEEQYHDSQEAENAFSHGFCVFKPGEPAITCVVQRRALTVLVGATVVFANAQNHKAVLKAIDKAVQQLR